MEDIHEWSSDVSEAIGSAASMDENISGDDIQSYKMTPEAMVYTSEKSMKDTELYE
jgi:hypothetical protein